MKRADDSEQRKSGVRGTLERLSFAATEWAGSAWAFAVACVLILGWAVTGPLFGFSNRLLKKPR